MDNGLVESDPLPAQALREGLAQQRALGNTFRWAWGTALMPAMRAAGREHQAWHLVFTETKSEWRAAFLNLPVEREFPVDLLSRFGEPAESWSVQQQGSRCS
jgi:hypothetical protein